MNNTPQLQQFELVYGSNGAASGTSSMLRPVLKRVEWLMYLVA